MADLTPKQADIVAAVSPYIGQRVEVITSDRVANICADFRGRAIFLGTVRVSALRGLESRGHIANLRTFWKGATFDVVRGAE